MKFRIVIIALFVLIIASFAYDNFYTPNMISGTYRYDFNYIIVEGPRHGDVLILTENGDFKSDTWGNGTYKIEGSTITFNYNYEYREGGFSADLYRPYFWGKPRISVSADHDSYFERK